MNAPAPEKHETVAGQEKLLPIATGRQTGRAVLRLLRAHRGLAAGAFTMLVIATGIGLLTAPLLGHIVDVVAAGDTAFALPIVLLALVALARGVTDAIGLTMVSRLGEGMLATLRETFVDKALALPLARVEHAGAGDLTSRVTSDVAVVATSVREALPELGRSVLTIVLTFGGLALLDWRFLIAALLAAPIQLHTVRWYVRHAIPLYAAQRVAVAAQQQQLLDTVGGARTVRAFRLTGDHVNRVRHRSQHAVDISLRGVRLMTRFFARLNLAEYVGLAAVLATGFLLVGNGTATVGTATAAALYFHSLFNPINTALALADDAQSAAASLARLVGVTDLPSESTGSTAPAEPGDSSVRISGLGHAYRPGNDVLRGVDLRVAPGERVAVVGASGAGKSTLAKLIAGVHRPSTGSICLGVDLHDLDPTHMRRVVALISQEVHVFAGPLADDLRLARPDASDEELRDALATVGALPWVRDLPDELSTVVGDGGRQLTISQAQQLALARLVLADPPIAILDEATAEAGSSGATVLEHAAERAVAGRTSIVIAHRLTQAVTADRVIVMDSGRVVETGTHDELVAAGGTYAELWAAWSDTRREPAG